MRLIDADALINKYGDWYTEEGTEEGYIGTIKGIVDSMPTIESERSLWFRIGEICVDESKGFISPGRAVEKIRQLLREAERWGK